MEDNSMQFMREHEREEGCSLSIPEGFSSQLDRRCRQCSFNEEGLVDEEE